jgi:ABC-2 type transport system ATP-binding protein
MLHDPQVLILDEPTIGLDPRQVVEVRSLIKALGQRHTILLSTHILSEVEQLCDRVIMIIDGRIWDDRPDGRPRRRRWQPRAAAAPGGAHARYATILRSLVGVSDVATRAGRRLSGTLRRQRCDNAPPSPAPPSTPAGACWS